MPCMFEEYRTDRVQVAETSQHEDEPTAPPIIHEAPLHEDPGLESGTWVRIDNSNVAFGITNSTIQQSEAAHLDGVYWNGVGTGDTHMR